MNITRRSILLILMTAAIIAGCKKREGTELQKVNLTVKVDFPDGFKNTAAASAEVKLINKGTGTVLTSTTNAEGIATFAEVISGTYDLSSSRTLSAEEHAAQTGSLLAMSLNASKPDVPVNPGVSTITLKLAGSAAGNLVIKEVYYTGSKTASGGTYFSDQFIELYNNSAEVIYLDGLCISDIYGNSGLINTNSLPTPFNTDHDHVYGSNVWRIPGTGKQHPLNPGASIIIAQDGVNHKEATLNPNSPVDLSKADWETYNERPDNRDADAPGVPNLERVYFTGGFDWLVTVFGPGIVIYKPQDANALEKVVVPGGTTQYVKVPNTIVLDAFEALKDGNSGSFKRIPAALDAGFGFASGTYTAESFRRKQASVSGGRIILQDTNNSGTDFEKLTVPTPKSFK
ncbi:DUF4876 domain-containing protein [Pedobacter deserti]|uniref:DUF4876 domain-containing protein n=1 Tax=Pedobacter deserti TaxID=2817382 RepID=UPI00210A52F1|nr:DUF4876 domain-containing protein [Pedobacter sp. SYSU D00382]